MVEDEPNTRQSLIAFIDSARRMFRGSTLLVPNAGAVLDSADACYWLHLRLLEVADIETVYPLHASDDFEENFWHHVNSMHRRIKSKACEMCNVVNQHKMQEALVNDAPLLDDAFAILHLHRQTSQSAVAYLLTKIDKYKGIDENALQKRISRALARSGRREEFREMARQNRKR